MLTPNKNINLRTISLILFAMSLSFSLSGCSDKDSSEAGPQIDRHLSNSINYTQQGQYRAAILEARNSLSKTPSAEGAIHLADLYLDLGQPRSAISQLENVQNKNDKLRLKLAEAHVTAQKYSSALAVLGETSDEIKKTTNYLLLYGQAVGGLGKLAEAEKSLQNVLQLDPNNESALQTQTLLAVRAQNETKVDTLYNKLAEHHGNSVETLLLLAKIEYQRTNFAKTEEYLMTAIHNTKETDVMLPEKSSVLRLLVQTLTQQGRFADAVPFNKLLSEANPGWQESQEALKSIVEQIQLGNWSEAEALLEQFRKDFPSNNTANSLLGLVNLQKGNYEEADTILENAVDPETSSVELIGASVISKLKSNEKLEAFGVLQEALQNKPDNAKLLALYGTLALEMEGNEQEGETSLLKVIELDPGQTRAYAVLADHYFKTNRNTKAKEILFKSYEFNPQIAELQYDIMRTLIAKDMKSDAQEFANRLKKEAPNSSSAWTSSALISMENQDYKTAATELAKSLKIDDENYTAYPLAAAVQLNLKNKKAAIDILESASEKFPNNRRVLVLAAQLYLEQKDYTNAERKAQALMKANEGGLASFIRADILSAKGKHQDAYDMLEQEWNNKPNHKLGIALLRAAKKIGKALSVDNLTTWENVASNNPQTHLAIGNAHLEQGRAREALTSFEKVLSLDENNLIALNNAAWFQQTRGNNKRAMELASKLLTQAGDNAAMLDTVGWIKMQNDDSSSLPILKKAAELSPESKEIQEHYQQARAKFQ